MAQITLLSQLPREGGVKDGNNRRQRLAAFVRSRRVKQGLMGAFFVVFLAAGWFYPVIGYFIPVCMVLGLGLALWRGRYWCDWLCPRGSFNDAWLARISPQRPLPDWLRATPTRVAVIAILMTVLTVQLIRLWPDWWAIGGFFVLLLTITTAVDIVLGLTYQQRGWCQICPIGTMSSWLGRNRRPLYLQEEKCRDCGLCSRTCPMQLAPALSTQEDYRQRRGDCLKCSLCVMHCPTAALSWREPDKKAA